ncbi:MAG: ArsR/SmtB family transcription factor [Steroidobacteraceae bacterium]
MSRRPCARSAAENETSHGNSKESSLAVSQYYALAAKKLAALAHPARLAMVRLLVRAGPAGLAAGTLGEACGLAPNAMTFHLQKLAHVGLVDSRRDGQFIIYRAQFKALLDLTESLVGACCVDSADKCGPRCGSAGKSRG